MWQDLRQAVKAIRKHPGFMSLAALVLGLGLGLNTAMFSIVYAMLLKPLPVANPHELASIYQASPKSLDRPHVLWSPLRQYFEKHNEAFTGLTAHWGIPYFLRADNETERVAAEWVLSNYFDVLGLKPALGRTFLPAENEMSNPDHAVVISHRLWMRRFSGDPAIVGKQIVLGRWGLRDQLFTVIGVAPAGFKGLSAPWTPTQVWLTFAQGSERPMSGISAAVFGRLKPGVSLEQAQTIIGAQGRTAYYQTPSANAENEPRFRLYATNAVRVPNDPSAALIPTRLAAAMTIVVGMVLLVAATNIAGILMARGVGRAGEIAVRRVLGAGPLRIARQLLAETLLLSALGGVAGLVLAVWLLGLFRALTPSEFALDVRIEPLVVLFTAAICLACGFIVGLVPALQAMRLNLSPWLSGGIGLSAKSPRRGLRHAIAVPQVACSLALLLVAGGYVRALLRLELADLGYQPHNLVVLSPALKPDPGDDPNATEGSRAERSAARSRRFYTQMLDRLRAVPGVADVAIAASLPLREPVARPDWAVVAQDDFLNGDRSGSPPNDSPSHPGTSGRWGLSWVGGATSTIATP